MPSFLKISAAGLIALLTGAAAMPVRVAVVHYAPAIAERVFPGSVQPRTHADLAFQAGGKVIRRPAEIGAHVRAGQLLAQLDPTDLLLAEQSAAAALAAAQADAANAASERARYERLGATSPAWLPSEYDRRRTAAAMAEARVTQAARQLALAHDQLAYTTLTADADGVITALSIQVGQVVSAGQTAATLAHTDQVEIAVDVPENLLAGLHVGDDVTQRLWAAPGQPLHGRIREIGALADGASRTYAVRVSVLDPPVQLALGMTAAVAFGVPATPVAALPETALSDRDGAPAMWVLDPAAHRATLRRVELEAYRGDGIVLVRAGLAEGEQVITAGASQIAPGMSLTAWQGPVR